MKKERGRGRVKGRPREAFSVRWDDGGRAH